MIRTNRISPLRALLLSLATLLAGCHAVKPSTGGLLQLRSTTAGAVEGSPATLAVSRSGSSEAAVAVRYVTRSGTATAAGDYIETRGTLRWAAGDTADRTITVPTLADGQFEEDERFTVTLFESAGGAALGSDRIAEVTIADNDPVPLRLLAFNDFHGNLNPPPGTTRAPDPNDTSRTLDIPAGGVEYLATLVRQLKTENPRTTVVAAGDLVGASPLVSALFHDEPAIAAMNALGLEFSAVGNHEFDDGRTELLRLQNGGCFPGDADTTCRNGTFEGAAFQYLAANVIDRDSGRSLFPGYGLKSFDVGGGRTIKVGFIGLVLRRTPGIVTPKGVSGLDFIDEADAANSLVPELKAAGVEAIVLLIHEGGKTNGLYNDKSCPGLSGDILPIVDRLDPAIDMVVSGHTHFAYNCVRNGRTLTSAGSYGRLLTRIDFTLDRGTRDIVAPVADNLVAVNDTAPNPAPHTYRPLARDPEQTALLDHYNQLVAPLANRVIGRVSRDLSIAPNAAGESVLGDVVADSQLAATRAPETGGAVVAFMNPGGIRASLIAAQISGGEHSGEITYGEAFAAQPFGDTLVTLTLTGAQIRTLLEQQFPPTQAQPRLLQVSAGFTYAYDSRGKVGEKVDAASLRIDGVAVDPAANYRVTVNNFLAAGGDDFPVFRQGSDQRGGALVLEAMTEYFATHSPVRPVPRNRITRIR